MTDDKLDPLAILNALLGEQTVSADVAASFPRSPAFPPVTPESLQQVLDRLSNGERLTTGIAGQLAAMVCERGSRAIRLREVFDDTNDRRPTSDAEE